MRAKLTRNVVPGVHRLEHEYVNCYLLEEKGRVTLVDAAHPRTWPHLVKALAVLGRTPTDVDALILTHAHFDHLGFAARVQHEWGVPIWAHSEDHYIAAHPYRYAHENPRLIYPIAHPRALRPLSGMVRAGALRVEGVTNLRSFTPGDTLDVAGHPEVVFSPGHTFGHCAFFLPASSALICGDALVTFNPYTGGHGAQIVSGAATADSRLALASLQALAATDARTVLPGHGPIWREGIAAATASAQRVGAS